MIEDVRSSGSAYVCRVSMQPTYELRMKRDAHYIVERPVEATGNDGCVVCREVYLREKK